MFAGTTSYFHSTTILNAEYPVSLTFFLAVGYTKISQSNDPNHMFDIQTDLGKCTAEDRFPITDKSGEARGNG